MGRPKKYNTEEERIIANRESKRQSYLKHKDEEEFKAAHRASCKRYSENHKAERAEYDAEYYQKNKEKIAKRHADYNQNKKEKILEHQAEYRSTKKGRANNLLSTYRKSDKKNNRGECTLTADWIVKNIFSQPCRYCGETDWMKLGCDRIDNNLPHTPENCVPCCWECNSKRGTTPYEEYLELICNSQTD